jgi:hypothetical protein
LMFLFICLMVLNATFNNISVISRFYWLIARVFYFKQNSSVIVSFFDFYVCHHFVELFDIEEHNYCIILHHNIYFSTLGAYTK